MVLPLVESDPVLGLRHVVVEARAAQVFLIYSSSAPGGSREEPHLLVLLFEGLTGHNC